MFFVVLPLVGFSFAMTHEEKKTKKKNPPNKTDLFYARLPPSLVPSYNGIALTYSYFVNVTATTSLGSGTQTRSMKLPLRVVCFSRIDSIDLQHPPLQVLKILGGHHHVVLSNHEDLVGVTAIDSDDLRGRLALARVSDELYPSEWLSLLQPHHRQPFVSSSYDLPQRFLHESCAEFFACAHEHSRTFNIGTKDRILVDWKTSHAVVQIGSDQVVEGVLDFSTATARTYRVHVSLERREVVKASLLKESRKGFAAQGECRVADWVECDVRNAIRVPVRLRVPPNAPQTFSTEWVSVRWVLRMVIWCHAQDCSSGDTSSEYPALFDDHESIPADEDMVRVDWELDVPLVVVSPSTLEGLRAFEPSMDSFVLA